jgi:Ulp1 family protease
MGWGSRKGATMTPKMLNDELASIYKQFRLTREIEADIQKARDHTSFQSYFIYGGLLRDDKDFNRLRRWTKKNDIGVTK